VDAAGGGDVIKIAAGTYSDVHGRPRLPGYEGSATITQVVYLSKSITLRGGYTTTDGFSDPPDPVAYPTVLDAEAQGRVLFIGGQISPTIEGLSITGGDATGMGGYYDSRDAGGGIYVLSSTVTISNNRVFRNSYPECGGGLYQQFGASRIVGNGFFSNSAAYGGGVLVSRGTTEVVSNTFKANRSANGGGGFHSHLSLATGSSVTLVHNVFFSNTAGSGGAVYMYQSVTVLTDNIIISNTAKGLGGGLSLKWTGARFSGNTISFNRAASGAGLNGELLALTLLNNDISFNTARVNGGGILYDWIGPCTLVNNTLIGNSAREGGAVYFRQGYFWSIGNVVAGNRAEELGGGFYFERALARILHTTFAQNKGDAAVHATDQRPQEGYSYIGPHSIVAMTNTILVGHAAGVVVDDWDEDNAAYLEGTLWGSGPWANGVDWIGRVDVGTINVWGDPDFVDWAAGDYHIGPASAALDAGLNYVSGEDMDGDLRPDGAGADIGADEIPFGVRVHKEAHPLPVWAGSRLSYTLRLTSTSPGPISLAITDVLPAQVTPGGTLTWTVHLPAFGSVWTHTFSVTVDRNHVGRLDNLVSATIEHGESRTHRCSVNVWNSIYLPLHMEVFEIPHRAGPREGVDEGH
jgi:hypothetical protein